MVDSAFTPPVRVFPARAGMIPLRGETVGVSYSIPRESGDDPANWREPAGTRAYSPRERG